ncbi:unnamed protein product [Musa acuminata subsp. burmannicoides]|uniref:(wild Malaysian banana) hypothetical protein n=1 Tax=Musa acuminata subsp. malaccensis TaxID=214687 RepID=A0A804JDW2_MUSAM|nr:PREDICTED: protein indeterminate-domain 16-like [Musa acuminata subsp. malaccensis]CAG1845619.1 unnamed protein product [Musa acuminata subsp. malaccensis]
MEEDDPRELQLLHLPSTHILSEAPMSLVGNDPSDHPLLDLNLSMSVGTQRSYFEESNSFAKNLQLLKQQTAEQIQLTAVEKAYAERIRELTRKEIDSAKKEFAQARLVWEQAREEVDKVERMKEIATRNMNPSCLEFTCHSCHQRFRP